MTTVLHLPFDKAKPISLNMAAAAARVSSCLYTTVNDVNVSFTSSARLQVVRFPRAPLCGRLFATGSPLLIQKASFSRSWSSRSASLSVRCEQGTKEGNGVDVWLGRLAMIGFAAAISVEITTGKGLLENFGLTSPLPTVALAVTGLVGVLTAIFIFQSASES
ncbi:hypothetical protein Leryth_017035 [Lithospermum erythrorhizon]|nr:hypothetical protein Leryth_017035 [Lithospermum erythrorhizon]